MPPIRVRDKRRHVLTVALGRGGRSQSFKSALRRLYTRKPSSSEPSIKSSRVSCTKTKISLPLSRIYRRLTVAIRARRDQEVPFPTPSPTQPTFERARPVPFRDILQMLLPPTLAKSKNISNSRVTMEKLKRIGATTWVVFKFVLKLVKDVSSACPVLQDALGGLFDVLDQLKMADNAQDGFFEVSSKLAALQFILARHRQSSGDQERLEGLASWVKSVTVFIRTQTDQHAVARFFRAQEDCRTVTDLLKSMESVIDFLMLDINMDVKHYVERLEMKVDDLSNHVQLKDLNHVALANWSAQKEDKCLAGTRCVVMSDLIKWCNDPSQPPVFWLSGMAGTGKSAIVRTLCDYLHRAHLLGGSFFCSRRGSAEQRDVRRIIPTLSRHLARLDPEYMKNVVKCLNLDADIGVATIDRQLEELLTKPQSNAFRALNTPLILVIDGLDEGAEAEDTARLLKAIFEKVDDMPFRFFLTSRPESHIREKFLPSSPSRQTILRLHEIEESMAKADIELYVKHRLRKMKEESVHRLPRNWPLDDQVQKLADRADKLFVYAFTACNYIRRNPVERLSKIIETTIVDERPLTQRLDEMYTIILDEAKSPDKVDDGIMTDIQKCLTALICVPETLSVTNLAMLMETDPARIRIVMDDLHSLILVPESNDDGPVTTLHASLGDYLRDEHRSKRHAITKDGANLMVLRRCFHVWESEFCFNVSGARTSSLSNEEQQLRLPYHLLYCAANWTTHLAQISPLMKPLKTFIAWARNTMIPRFLFWLEVMSVGKMADKASEMLLEILPLVKTEPDIVEFLDDALSFINGSIDAIRHSAPHIYLSALALCPQGSRIKQEFETQYPGLPIAHREGVCRSHACVLCINALASLVTDTSNSDTAPTFREGHVASNLRRSAELLRDPREYGSSPKLPPAHTGWVNSVTFSPDGRYFVTASRDRRVRIWDAHTARAVLELLGHTKQVNSVVFSPDGKLIASGSSDNTVLLWDAKIGKLVMKPLRGHTGPVTSVSFSPDGKRIVSGSADHTICIWDIHPIKTVMVASVCYTHPVNAVSFSPDGRYIASALDDNTVRMCDVRTPHAVLRPLRAHTAAVTSVAFSPDGKYIISGSNDHTLCLWIVASSRLAMNRLRGHYDSIFSVAFSPDGGYIISGSCDQTVRLWDVTTGEVAVAPMIGHSAWVLSVAFSPDGKRVISSSYDGTVRLWNVRTAGAEPRALPAQLSWHNTLNDDHLVFCSNDGTSRIWHSHTGWLDFKPLRGQGDSARSVAFEFDSSHSSPRLAFTLPSPINGNNTQDKFFFDLDTGWIVSPQNKLFLWIPADIRFALWSPSPSTTRIISKRSFYLDLSRFSYGLDWMACRRPLDLD